MHGLRQLDRYLNYSDRSVGLHHCSNWCQRPRRHLTPKALNFGKISGLSKIRFLHVRMYGDPKRFLPHEEPHNRITFFWTPILERKVWNDTLLKLQNCRLMAVCMQWDMNINKKYRECIDRWNFSVQWQDIRREMVRGMMISIRNWMSFQWVTEL